MSIDPKFLCLFWKYLAIGLPVIRNLFGNYRTVVGGFHSYFFVCFDWNILDSSQKLIFNDPDISKNTFSGILETQFISLHAWGNGEAQPLRSQTVTVERNILDVHDSF